jgi:hypothetical protein
MHQHPELHSCADKPEEPTERSNPVRLPHFVLTLGRSGSNALVDMLNQNPAILNFGEVLGDWTPVRKMQRRLGLLHVDDSQYLDFILGSRAFLSAANTARTLGKLRNGRLREIKSIRKIESVGVKDFSLNLVRAGLSEFLLTRPHIKVVGLLRQNVVDRMVSNETLEATGLVKIHEGDVPARQHKVHIRPETAIEKLATIEQESLQLEQMIAMLPEERIFRVYYSRFFSSPAETEETVRQVYRFLGVSDYRPKVRMKKILQVDPLCAVENEHEVRRAIAQSRFAHYLAQ